jgi:trk system potassium uptake protein TrkA
MKFIIIGLGNFGSSLAARLTSLGHEVIGVDVKMEKVEIYKDTIFQTICLDSTNEQALATLPLKECDYSIVTIGEDFGASVMTTALLKQAGVKNLISRAINPLHHKVIEALGVDLILQPEYDAASRFADSILFSGLSNSYDITDEYKIIEARLPDRYDGMLLSEVDFTNRHSLLILTIIRTEESKSLFGQSQRKKKSLGLPSANQKLQLGDQIVLFGKLKDIERLLHAPEE